MANKKSLIARLLTMSEADRWKIYDHHDRLAEMGYEVPSGADLRKGVRDKIKRDKERLLNEIKKGLSNEKPY